MSFRLNHFLKTTSVAGALHALVVVGYGQVIWDGGAGTGNWTDANNWSANVIPAATGAVIQFAGSVQTVVDTQADRSVASLTFNSGASAFTVNNNTITLTGNGTVLANNSTANQTINSSLKIGNNRTFSATSGDLALNGNILLNTFTLTVTGAFDTTMTGVISNGALSKTGTGTLTVSNANTFSGGATLNGGVLRATTDAAALGAGALTLTSGTLELAADTGLNFGRNTTIGGTVTVVSDRLTAGDGVEHTLGTLTTSAARAMTVSAGSNVTGGVAGLVFGQTTLGGNLTATLGANTQLTLGALNASNRSIIQNGTGTLLFNAAPSGGLGGLTINGGAALLGASNALGSTALTAVTVNATTAGATALFDLNGNDQSVLSLTFGGAGVASTNNVSTGAGTLTLGGNVTYTATGNPFGSTLSGNVSLGSATRTFTIGDSTAADADLTVSAGVTGTGGLTKAGAGELVLSGSNNYGGTTTLSAGTLRAAGGAGSLGTGALALTAGTLELAADTDLNFGRNTTIGGTLTLVSDRLTAGAGTTQTLGTFTTTAAQTVNVTAGGNVTSGTAGIVFGQTNLGNTLTANIGANSQLTLGSLNAAAARTITKTGAGTLYLSDASVGWITGSALTINNGTVQLGADNAFGATALTAVTVNATTAGTTALFDLNGHDQSVLSLTFGGTTGTASTNNVSTGAGTLTLGGNVTYTATGNPFGSTLSGNLSLGSATRTFTIGDSTGAANDLTVSAAITGGAGVGLTKAGAGTLVLSGASSYAGPTTLSAGTLRATTNAGALGAGNLTYTAGTLELAGDTDLAFGRNTAINGTATLVSNRDTAGVGTTHTLGTLTTTAAQTLNLTAGGNVTSGTAGFAFGQSNLGGNLTVNAGANSQLALGALNAAAARTITKTGAGTLFFSDASAGWITGSALAINNGTVQLGASNAFGSTALTTVTVNATTAGATALLDLNGNDQTVASLTFGGAGVASTNNVFTGAGTLTLGGNVTYTATGNPFGSTLSGNLSLGAATRTFLVGDSTAATDDLTVSAAIAGATGVGLTKTGAGTLVLSGANTYAGATTLTTGIIKAGAANSFSSASAVTVGTGTTLNLAGYDQTIGSLAGVGSVTLGGATLASGNDNTSTTFGGAISGTGGITKNGTGTLVLSTANNYTGTTTVSGGVLRASNATSLGTAAGGTTVGSGGTLELSGGLNFGTEALTLAGTGYGGIGALRNVTSGTILSGGVTLSADALVQNDAGTLALNGALNTAGNVVTFGGTGTTTLGASLGGNGGIIKSGAGSLVFGAAQITTGSVFIGEGTLSLGGFASSFGTLHITGDSIIDFVGTSTLTVDQLIVDSGVTLTINGWANAVDYFYANNDPASVNLGRIQFATFATSDTKWLSYNKQITPVPEPGVYGMIFVGASLGWVAWRRRRAA